MSSCRGIRLSQEQRKAVALLEGQRRGRVYNPADVLGEADGSEVAGKVIGFSGVGVVPAGGGKARPRLSCVGVHW